MIYRIAKENGEIIVYLREDKLAEETAYKPIKISCNKEKMLQICEALESGKYPQISNYLKTDQGYCCLGVITEKSETGTWVRCIDRPKIFAYELDGEYNKFSLSYQVLVWLEILPENNPVLFSDEGKELEFVHELPLLHNEHFDSSITAADLNDEYEANFKEIAYIFRIVFLPETVTELK